MKKIHQAAYHKTDLEGRPFYIDLIAKCKIEDVFKLADEATLIKFFVQGYERVRNVILPCCTEEKGDIVQDTFCVIDAEGLGVSMLYGEVKKLIDLSSKVAQAYYPETLYKMMIINTSFMFSMLWSMLKGFLDKKTSQKVIMQGSDFLEELLQYVI